MSSDSIQWTCYDTGYGNLFPLLLIAILLAGCNGTSSSDLFSASMHGVVYDSRFPPQYSGDSGLYQYTGVPGVRVIIDGQERAVTDNTGRFEIDRIRSNAVIEITFMQSSWETVTSEFDTSRDTNWHFPFEQSLTPILEEYYTFKKGSYWTYYYYRYSESHNELPDISRGEYKWEVVNEYQENQETWYELRTEMEYDEYEFENSTDSTFKRSVSHIETLKVKRADWRYIIKNNPDSDFNKFVLSNSFLIGSPDDVTEIKPKIYYPYTSRDTRKVYRRDVGLIFREHKISGWSGDVVEIWTLIDNGT
jgi:hypothetical protein